MTKSKPELFRMLFEYFSDELDLYVLTGVVKSLNEDEKSCIVIPDNGEPEVQNVRYVVNPSVSQGVQRVPKVGSQVSIGFLDVKNGNYAMIVDMQEFDRIVYDSGENTTTVSEKLTEKLNDLVEEVNDLKSKYEQHVHGIAWTGVAGVGTSSAIVGSFVSKKINTFESSDYNYSKILLP